MKTSSYYYYTKNKIKKENKSDFWGVVSIGENQTSYKYKEHTANLPFFYSSKDNKLCLTYIIQLVYDKQDDGNLKILGLVLISVPNGALKEVYKEEICGGSKNKNEAFRYYYRNKPKFELLEGKPYRVEVLFQDCHQTNLGLDYV